MSNKTFGETVKGFRTAKNLTQRHLAKALGMDTSYYSKLEANKLAKNHSPNLYTIDAFCKVLNLTFVQELELYTSANKVHPAVLEKVLRVQRKVINWDPKEARIEEEGSCGLEFYLTL